MEVRRINPTVAILLTVLALSLIGSASASNIYRWTAPDGTVSYGSTPPPDVEAERIRGATQSPPSDQSGSSTQQPESTASSGPDAQQEERDTEMTQRERECAKAEENLEILENPAARLTTAQDGGDPEPVTEELREQMLQETREFLDEWCR